MATRVVLHVGVMKSGTTFIQRALLANQERLAQAGILFPGKRWRAQVVAARDVMTNVTADGNALAADGPWHTMVQEVRDWSGTAIISMEYLGPRSEAQIEAICSSFAGLDLQVVVTARDLARSITSMWTETVQNAGTTSWPDYLLAIRLDKRSAGKSFWRQQRLTTIVERWTAAVGRDHFTLITVPPPGGPRGALWERFCEVAQIPAGLCELDVPRNKALDAPSALVMRALNERLVAAGLSDKDYDRFVKRGLAKNGINQREETGASVGLDQRWVFARARKELDRLRELDPRVVGDLTELESRKVPGVHTRKVSTQDQLDAALDGLAAAIGLWAEDTHRREAKARKRRQKKGRKK